MIPGLDIPIIGARFQEKNVPANLTTHPAKTNVMDLIRIIVIDSLSLPMPSKGAPCVLDMLLEVRLITPNKLLENVDLVSEVMGRL